MNLPLGLRLLLWPFSVLYELYARVRAWLYAKGWLASKRLHARVISVGNLSVGGTGKTPMVIWLAEKFLSEGKRVGILSRGYRGSNGTSDEVELMKSRLGPLVKFGIGKDRYSQGARIESQEKIDIILLDDGFQHLRLCRDMNILMLDGSQDLTEQWILPAGTLREPISACRRADCLIVTRKHEKPELELADGCENSVFYAQTRLLGFRNYGEAGALRSASEIGVGPFFAFCGIGNAPAFFDDLEQWHLPVAGKKAFRDHHRYSASDLESLAQLARAAGAIALVTTEKDTYNFPERRLNSLPIVVVVISFAISPECEFTAALERKLGAMNGTTA
ncbi:MAG TPA: tetraacyldisaccharide 4'-kinase [Candidatus Acidoferrum sp.]|nr:tetraacyldisaccharide 4'-kinase [Candidatus Acidoferrum sp.]